MLGMEVTLPIYVAPAAMAKLGHPDGEVNITKAAGKTGIIQGVSLATVTGRKKGCELWRGNGEADGV
jgi:isopentenyl diphosphate isomerase/L-lactate dehydrogenase-like FMN-dependent dehydrogenase